MATKTQNPTTTAIAEAKDRFTAVIEHTNIPYPSNFASEAGFAMQILEDSSFIMNKAKANPKSLTAAIVNVAAAGLSLNPALGQAYLIPRKSKIVLDIGYRGMIAKATQSGAVKAVHADLVHENDEYERYEDEFGTHFKHARPRLGEQRGEIQGAYCRATLADGTIHLKELSLDELHKRRAKSESWKKDQTGPWKDFPEEMYLKSAIRAGAKTWPTAIDKRFAIPESDEIGDDQPTERNITPDKEATPEILPPEPAETTYIDGDQVVFLEKMCEAATLPIDLLCSSMQVGCLEEIESDQYAKASAKVEDFDKRMQKLAEDMRQDATT